MQRGRVSPPIVQEISGRQMAGRAFLFFIGCISLFRGAIWLADTFYH
jgi:hypothetical protein